MVIELTTEQINQVNKIGRHPNVSNDFVNSVQEIRNTFNLGLLEAKTIVECIREVQGYSVNSDSIRLAGLVFAQIVRLGRQGRGSE